MKKLRIVLSSLAFTFAIALAAGLQLQAKSSGTIDGYKFLTNPNRCDIVPNACGVGTTPCTISGYSGVLKDSSTPNCGADLQMQ
jgi:hypothetical protein